MARIPLTIIAVVVSAMLAYFIGPAIETRFLPVYSRFEVESAEPVEGGTLVSFRFTKYRTCEARGWAWYIGEFGAVSRQVEISPAQAISRNRPLGESVSSPYIMAASPDEIRTQMHAEIYSDCGLPWYTRSVVYP